MHPNGSPPMVLPASPPHPPPRPAQVFPHEYRRAMSEAEAVKKAEEAQKELLAKSGEAEHGGNGEERCTRPHTMTAHPGLVRTLRFRFRSHGLRLKASGLPRQSTAHSVQAKPCTCTHMRSHCPYSRHPRSSPPPPIHHQVLLVLMRLSS